VTATRSSHFPFAVRLDRSHFATRSISFPISHFSAISSGRDSIRSSISFPNPWWLKIRGILVLIASPTVTTAMGCSHCATTASH